MGFRLGLGYEACSGTTRQQPELVRVTQQLPVRGGGGGCCGAEAAAHLAQLEVAAARGRQRLGQHRLQGCTQKERRPQQVEGQRRPAALGERAADGRPDGEGEEAERLDEPEQAAAVLRVLCKHIHLVGGGGGAGRASGRRTHTHHESRGHELGHRARRRGHDLPQRVDDCAEHERRLAADDVDEVADGQVEEQLRHLRQRHQQAHLSKARLARLPEAERLCEHGQHDDAHADSHLDEEGGGDDDGQLLLRRRVEHERPGRRWYDGLVRLGRVPTNLGGDGGRAGYPALCGRARHGEAEGAARHGCTAGDESPHGRELGHGASEEAEEGRSRQRQGEHFEHRKRGAAE
eukprot:scaffold104192_cov63-Phaeocystis_antarctica.AAC.2